MAQPLLRPTNNRHEPKTDSRELDEGDVSLIHWMLELTPAQRIEASTRFLQDMMALRSARKITR